MRRTRRAAVLAAAVIGSGCATSAETGRDAESGPAARDEASGVRWYAETVACAYEAEFETWFARWTPPEGVLALFAAADVQTGRETGPTYEGRALVYGFDIDNVSWDGAPGAIVYEQATLPCEYGTEAWTFTYALAE
jgi:hypothetical protein